MAARFVHRISPRSCGGTAYMPYLYYSIRSRFRATGSSPLSSGKAMNASSFKIKVNTELRARSFFPSKKKGCHRLLSGVSYESDASLVEE